MRREREMNWKKRIDIYIYIYIYHHHHVVPPEKYTAEERGERGSGV